MLSIEHDFVDPLFRPPLALAITAASLKYLATAWVLDDPLLKTDETLRKERDLSMQGKAQLARAILRLIFLVLAVQVLIEDARRLLDGLPQVSGFQRIHAFAMVLAFSPNTVAAVAAACIVEVKFSWLRDLPFHRSRLGVLSDSVATAYGAILGMAYVGPLIFVSMAYGLFGAVVVCYAFFCDFISLPWRLYTGHMNAVWIAVPVFNAWLLWTAVYMLIIIGYNMLVQHRYPEMAEQVRAAGRQSKMIQEHMPHQVAARIIGVARDLGLSKLGVAAEGQSEAYLNVDMDHLPLYNVRAEETYNVQAEETAKCILNDQGLLLVFTTKVFLCISLPLLQLCVIVAARVYLGEGLWMSALHSFEERTWDHYIGNVSLLGRQRLPSLVWLYL